ncbi:MAG: TonB-dependent receptor, partial [Prevotella sp.]|nr:TonB-dependent receptor [Prevotella sp.]
TFLGQWEMNMGNSNNQTTAVSNVPTGIEVPSVDGKRIAPSSGNSEWRSMSMTFQSHMSYKSRYVLGFSYRADGRTGLEDARKWSYSPSVSGRWNFIDEPFMKGLKPAVSMLAFRFGWGVVGNLPRTDLQFASYITSGNYGIYDVDAISYLEALQLNRLQVERTMEYNIGGNFGFFNDLITGDFNYYFRRTRDMLMSGIRIPSTTGFSKLGQANVGEMTNKGWELNLNANRFLKIGKFEMSMNFNIAQNINEIVEMEESVLEANNPDWNASDRGTYLKRIQVGNPLGSIYGLRFKGVYQYSYDYLINLKNSHGWNGDQFRDYINDEFLATGKTAPIAIGSDGRVLMDSHGNPIRLVYNFRDGSPMYKFRGGDAIYEDINNDGQINSLDIVYLGNSNPKINGGFGFSFFYDNWTLKTHFTYRFGHKVINTARMNLEEMYNAYNQSSAVNWRWRKNGDVTTIPRALFNSGYNWQGSDRYVEDASFVRFTYVQLSYRFKKKFVQSLGLRNLQLSVAGQNILTFSKYSTGIEN